MKRNRNTTITETIIDPTDGNQMMKVNYDLSEWDRSAKRLCVRITETPSLEKTNSYKDSSSIFKSNVPATSEHVHTGLFNSEGYPILKVKTRTGRIPIIGLLGDRSPSGPKFSSIHEPIILKTTDEIVYFMENRILPRRIGIDNKALLTNHY